jgi:hypothetical protein
MSLMKLLSVSKSFVSGRNPAGRYRVVEQGLLPKFAPAGRPSSFAQNKKRDESQTSGNEAASRTAAASSESLPPTLALDPPTKKISHVVRTEPVSPAPPTRPAAGCTSVRPESKNWLPRNPFTNRAADPARTVRPVQTELSLDAVRPVRNDLSDADLEVVLAGCEATSVIAPKPARGLLLKAELGGLAWSRLTARWFGSGRVRS